MILFSEFEYIEIRLDSFVSYQENYRMHEARLYPISLGRKEIYLAMLI